MKKSFLITFLALFSLSALADIAPDFTLRARAPKPFFEKISSLYRRIHPDPKLEMQAAFALMPFGYPDFGGISKRENAVVCGFATETENPVYVLGFKSDGNSRMEKTLAARNIKPVKKGGYTFFSLPTDADARYIDAAFGEFSKVGHSLAEIDATPEAFNRLAKGAFGKYTADIESANVKIDADARTIKLCATVKLKKGSPLCNAVNEVRRVKEAEEAEFLPRDAEIFAITKAHVPDGIFDTQAAKGVLPQRLAERIDSLRSKNAGTYAAAVYLGGTPKSLGIGATEMTERELLALAESEPEVSVLGLSAKNRAEKIGGTACLATECPNGSTVYSAVVNGLSVSSDDKNLFAEAVAKIKSARGQAYPLKKYARDDSDFVAVLNNNALLKSMLGRIGASLDKAAFENTVISADVGLGKIEITASIDIDSLNLYCDFLRLSKNGRTR